MAPYDLLWADYGWAFSLWPIATRVGYPIILGYFTTIIVVGLHLIKKAAHGSIRLKYKIMLVGCIIYFIPINVTNILIWKYPATPPFGGILLTVEFLFIAWALSLSAEKIEISFDAKYPINKLFESYLQFLAKVQTRIPGRELGVNAYKFPEYIEAMGMGRMVYFDKGQKLTFNSDKITGEDIDEIPDSILKTVKELRWGAEIADDFAPIVVRTYKIVQSQSERRANKWLEHMLQRHGGFLAKHGVLATMPRDAKIPRILKDLDRRTGYLLKEEKPEQAYKKLNEALSYGFTALCISKLHPEEVRERYNIGKVPIFWLTFKKAERTISPKDSAQLNRTISEFLKTPEASIILFDCFDQIKAANGFQKSLTIFKELMSLRGADNSIMLVSVNPHMFEEGQLETLKKELEEAETDRA